MRRIVIAGAPGAGKTTLGKQMSTAMDIPYAELDALYHGPNWTKRPTFEAEVDEFTRGSDWIVEWQYHVRPLLEDRADTLLWLDLPLPVVMFRVTRRTLERWIRREKVWGGNREQPPWKIFTDRANMIRWSFASRHQVRNALPRILRDHPNMQLVRLRTRADAARFLVSLHRQPETA